MIAGLVTSFSAVTLVGSALLSLLHLPQDAIRWVALAALVTIGLGLIFPQVEQLLEKPFARLPQKQIATRSGGFLLGLTLGVLYVPCAGPVLAAIVVAGATGSIGIEIVVLTLRVCDRRRASPAVLRAGRPDESPNVSAHFADASARSASPRAL